MQSSLLPYSLYCDCLELNLQYLQDMPVFLFIANMFEQLLLKVPPEALAQNSPWLVVKKTEPKRDEFPQGHEWVFKPVFESKIVWF